MLPNRDQILAQAEQTRIAHINADMARRQWRLAVRRAAISPLSLSIGVAAGLVTGRMLRCKPAVRSQLGRRLRFWSFLLPLWHSINS